MNLFEVLWRHPFARFSISVAGLGWFMLGIFTGAGGNFQSSAGAFVLMLYGFVPLGATVYLERSRSLTDLRRHLGFPLRFSAWFLLAWLAPPLMAFAALLLALLLPGVSWDPSMQGFFIALPEAARTALTEASRQAGVNPFWMVLGQSLIGGLTISALTAWGEEVGWRGYLLRAGRDLGFWRSSLLTGLAWGVWQSPLVMVIQERLAHPFANACMVVLVSMLLSPLLAWLRLRSGTTLAAAMGHGSFSASYWLSISLLSGNDDLTTGSTGVAGVLVLVALNLLLALRFNTVRAAPYLNALYPETIASASAPPDEKGAHDDV